MPRRLIPALLCLLACSGDKGGDTSAANLPFCEKMTDGNTQEFETGGGNGESGLVSGPSARARPTRRASCRSCWARATGTCASAPSRAATAASLRWTST